MIVYVLKMKFLARIFGMLHYRDDRVPRFAKMEFPVYDGKGLGLPSNFRLTSSGKQVVPKIEKDEKSFELGRVFGRMQNSFRPAYDLEPLRRVNSASTNWDSRRLLESFELLLGRTTGVTPE
uniref:Uncharacterized protein n=1 Tax=Lactuca sativa TaxID=4236 RepID=A0A9R1WLR3_LACSA|nr:hypothetical protein LSAT_V11C100022680 [Lactuca sativa]